MKSYPNFVRIYPFGYSESVYGDFDSFMRVIRYHVEVIEHQKFEGVFILMIPTIINSKLTLRPRFSAD
jgi:hypothetical protein